ncbi:MAG: 16S rRNA (uracil(1498)-N(3))-methyltransferase, partial [Immundisolibacteraceae bacterium]|nr:16S rRNA (uracil(1498)-N(3))-methyltransferase [Immundisolibacteraceae bacterium]
MGILDGSLFSSDQVLSYAAMRDVRIYIDQPLISGDIVDLPDALVRHIGTVLRLKAGDALVLFNGLGGEFHSRIQALARRSGAVSIGEHNPVSRESGLHTRLVQALGKGDRTEWALRKAVELGVTEIVPLITERTQVKISEQKNDQRQRRWQGLIVAACEQSGRTRLPLLRPVATFEQWTNGQQSGKRLILDPRASQPLTLGRGVKEVELLVGPEGGFSSEEYALASSRGYLPAKLGPRILRTETAPLAALALLQF